MSAEIKKRRSENWTPSDKILLRSLVMERLHVVENKTFDTGSNKSKKDAWECILTLFNAASDTPRTVVQLQFQWRGMKLKVKRAESSYRKESKATGGGPPPKLPDKEDLEIIELLPQEFIRDSNKFDREGTVPETVKLNIQKAESIEYIDYEDVFEEELIEEQLPKKKESSVIFLSPRKQTRKRKFNRNQNDENEKTSLYKLAKVHMEEEHEKRMEILEPEKQIKIKQLEKLQKELDLLL